MPKLIIDGKEISVQPGTTILEAARDAGISIPSMCFIDGCTPQTSCLVCVVRVNGSPRLVPSCATMAAEGMVVDSSGEDVITARRTALELLLGDHVGDCIAPCQNACPAHMNIPLMISHIRNRKYRDAIEVIKKHIALPAVLGNICPDLCEKGCRRSVNDASVSICQLKRFAAEFDLFSDEPFIPERLPSTGKKVAIIGAGPAGLSAAYYLLQFRHSCTVFDSFPEPGGMVRYGISDARLPRKVLDAEIDLIQKMGAEFRQNFRMDDSKSLDALSKAFDAVLLATGKVDLDEAAGLGLKMTSQGIHTDKKTMMTDRIGVFAVGGAVSPTHHAVRACADGRSAAIAINQFLNGEHVDTHQAHFSVHIGRLLDTEIPILMEGINKSQRLDSSGERFDNDEAYYEASRCMHCECGKADNCKLRDYSLEYKANSTKFKGVREHITRDLNHPYLVYEAGKCISCGLCIQLAEIANEPLGLAFIGRGFDVRPGVPFDEPLSKSLQKTAHECVEACPTGALVIKGSPSIKDVETTE
ncbi:MAG: 2Fe-2S iron-sulfur cluster-binding protein [Armatimonadota bacterium]